MKEMFEILKKSGKIEIPLHVAKAESEKAKEYEEEIGELNSQIEALKKKVAKAREGLQKIIEELEKEGKDFRTRVYSFSLFCFRTA